MNNSTYDIFESLFSPNLTNKMKADKVLKTETQTTKAKQELDLEVVELLALISEVFGVFEGCEVTAVEPVAKSIKPEVKVPELSLAQKEEFEAVLTALEDFVTQVAYVNLCSHMEQEYSGDVVSTFPTKMSADPKVVHFYNPKNPKGGVTVAYCNATKFKNCRMVEVAVSYCSENTQFNLKIGKENAISSFLSQRTLLVPARSYTTSEADVIQVLRDMFYNPFYGARWG